MSKERVKIRLLTFVIVFQAIFLTSAAAASQISEKYEELGGASSFLGEPTCPEKTCQHNSEGRYRHYKGGSIFYHPRTGAHEIHDPIQERWEALGGYSEFGFPTTDVRSTRDEVGLHSEFFQVDSPVPAEAQYRSSIFWHPQWGAREVIGPIRTRWKEADWAAGWLGYPLTPQFRSVDQVLFNRFENGFIFYVPHTGRGAKAVGYGPYADKTDPCLNLAHEDLKVTDYGNLKDFADLMADLHGIDLYRGKVSKELTKTRSLENWHIANFWHQNILNGVPRSEKTRLVVTIAELFLMQWHFLDLPSHTDLRKGQIGRYFKSPHCFKRNWNAKTHSWNYNDWCSEFASYVYKRSGNPRHYGARQTFWCKVGRYEKLDWCFSRVSYFRGYFRDRGLYVPIADIRNKVKKPPQLGDYISFEGHSMIVVGFVPNTDESIPSDDYGKSRIYVVEGNSGSGAPQGSNKKLHFGSITLDDSRIVGVGRMGLQDYAIQEPPSGPNIWRTEPRGIPEEQVQPLALRRTKENRWELRAFFPPQEQPVDLYVGLLPKHGETIIYYFDEDNIPGSFSSRGKVAWRQGVRRAQWETIFSVPAESVPSGFFDQFWFFSIRTPDSTTFRDYDLIFFSGAWEGSR